MILSTVARRRSPKDALRRWRKPLVVLVLACLTAVLVAVERAGVGGPPRVALRGDLRREAQFFGQYGQLGCIVATVLLIWHLDPRRRPVLGKFLLCLAVTASLSAGMKHGFGRIRPGHAAAGQFVGFSIEPDSERESFPSGHTATAAALTVMLSALYPRARAVFWTLAITCAGLRYVTHAHWLSDVLGGFTLGYAAASVTLAKRGIRGRAFPRLFGRVYPRRSAEGLTKAVDPAAGETVPQAPEPCRTMTRDAQVFRP